MANSTAALRKELALTVTDPFALLVEALQRNDELRDRVQLLERALAQTQKKGCSPATPYPLPRGVSSVVSLGSGLLLG